MLRRFAAGCFALGIACSGASEPVAEAAEATAVTTPAVPDQTTPADALSPGTFRHTLLLQINRDFGKQHFAIALDGWVDSKKPEAIADVRLWWLKTHKDGERGPFSKKSSKHFEVRTKVVAPDHWKVHLDTKNTRFTFDITLKNNKLTAYATVVADGQDITKCRAKRGTLRAKKLLGAAVGIDSLAVTCVTPGGKTITAPMKASKR